VVDLPGASGALTTDRIMIRPAALQAEYLPEVRWADPTPQMMQTLILRSLENTQGLRYVGRRPIGPGGDVALVSELTDFQAEVMGPDSARITLRLIARILREDDARVIATRIFTAGAEVPSVQTADIVQGFDQATGILLNDRTRWTMDTLNVGLRAPGT
jgi:cholesterol transport system auxiliary component